MSTHREIERTYSPRQAAELPDLVGTGAVALVGEATIATLDAVYFDTVDLRLTRAGISLRRRTGGDDAGWHLKLPVDDDHGREEVRRALGSAVRMPPKALRDLVLAWTLGADVVPVAEITTRRTTRLLSAADGRVLAEVADDETTARRPEAGTGEETLWRELEVELVDADADLLDAVEERLRGAGFVPAEVGRKIEVALADVLPDAPRARRVSRKRPASRVLHARLVEQLAELRRCESEVRRGRPDAVHRTRVAARRLRSALRTYSDLLDGDLAGSLQADLKGLVRALGPERDLEVAAERVEALLGATDPELVVGPVRRRVRAEVRTRMRERRAATAAQLASAEHLALLDALDVLVADPPWTPLAARRAAEVLPALVRKDAARLRKRAGDADDDEQLHRARSAAKRLRHAAEALRPAYGADAKHLARTAKKLQQPLGVLQDTRASRALLRELAAAADAAGESSFTYGHWHAREEAAAAEARDLFAARWRRAAKRRGGRALRLG